MQSPFVMAGLVSRKSGSRPDLRHRYFAEVGQARLAVAIHDFWHCKAAKICMMSGGFVYMMTNRRNGTLYVGVTSDLVRRLL